MFENAGQRSKEELGGEKPWPSKRLVKACISLLFQLLIFDFYILMKCINIIVLASEARMPRMLT